MAAAGRTLMFLGILVNSVVYSVFGQWVQTNGPCGGSFETIAIDDSVLYTSVFGKGVFRTANEGKNWTVMNDGLTGKDILSLVSLDNDLFAGTEFNGIHIYSGSSGRWSRLESKSGRSYERIINMTVQQGEIWAATADGLVKLHKKNNDWVDSLIHPLIWSQAVAVTDSFLFISSGESLKRSLDRGVTWTACTAGLPQTPISCLIMLDDMLGFIGTETGAYTTSNGGASWSIIGGGMETADNFFIRSFTARNDTILFSSSDRIWLSIDRGKSWADFNTAYTFRYPGRIGLNDNSIFLATSTGILKSSFTDRKWIDISAGIVSGNVTAMMNAGGTIFAGSDANGQLYRSDDNGMNWTVSDSGFESLSKVYALAHFDSMLFAGCDNQGLMQSTDFGRSWMKVDFKTSITWSFIEMYGTLFIGQYTAGIQSLEAGGSALLDANTGLELEIPDCGCSAPYPTPLSFTALGDTIFAALENHGVFTLTDSGAAWHSVNNGLSDTNVTKLFTTNGILLAATQDNGIFRSIDRGASWSSCATNLSGIPILAFADNGTTVFAGTANGVFHSSDTGVTWNKGETEFSDSVKSLLVVGDYLLAGTATRGVWRRPVGDFQAGAEKRQFEHGVKSTIVSMQKLGHTFSCRFKLARVEWVTVKLYNLQGKLIELFQNSRLSSGEHIIESDLRKYKSGCYVIRFEGGSVRRSAPFTIY